MKKLLLTLSLIVVILMSGCNAHSDDYVTREEFEQLEDEVAAIQSYLDRVVWSGYLLDEKPDITLSNNDIYVSVNFFESMSVKEVDLIDKSKVPDYIWDEFDNYISTNDVFSLLSAKYLSTTSQTYINGDEIIVTMYQPSDMSNEDYMARLSMLLLELSEYDFYTLDMTLDIVLIEGASQTFQIPLKYFNNDKYVISAHMFYNEMFEINIEDTHNPFIFDKEAVSILVQGYIDNDDFDGYVLPNYK